MLETGTGVGDGDGDSDGDGDGQIVIVNNENFQSVVSNVDVWNEESDSYSREHIFYCFALAIFLPIEAFSLSESLVVGFV